MVRIKLYCILFLVAAFVSGCVFAPRSAEPSTPTASPTPFSLWTLTPAPTLVPTATSEVPLAPTDTPIAGVTDVPQPVETQAPATTEYTVGPGDTLFGVAVEYDVPMAAIQIASDMGTETVVKSGQVLNIPAPGDLPESWADANPFWVLYEVQAGETLSEIAKEYDLELDYLLQVNDMADANLVRVGTLLVLPLKQPQGAYNTGNTEAFAAELPAAPPDPPTATPVPPPTTTPVPEPVQTTAPVPTSTPVPPLEAVEAPADMAVLAQRIFVLINEQRAMYGLPALAWNNTLALAAQNHAEDCYQRGYCGHYGSDGSSYLQRLTRVGYPYVRWSECWAWYGTPELAVAMWMDEVPPNDAHRRTILSDYLLEVGVGVMPGNGHGYYFIADFGSTQ